MASQLIQQEYDESLHFLNYTFSKNYVMTVNATKLEKETIFWFLHILFISTVTYFVDSPDNWPSKDLRCLDYET